jgi:hypothetical protein
MLQHLREPYGYALLKAKLDGEYTCDFVVFATLSAPPGLSATAIEALHRNANPYQKYDIILGAGTNGNTRFSSTTCKRSELIQWGIDPAKVAKPDGNWPVVESSYKDHRWIPKRLRPDKKGRPNAVNTCAGTLEAMLSLQSAREDTFDQPLMQLIALFDPVSAGQVILVR